MSYVSSHADSEALFDAADAYDCDPTEEVIGSTCPDDALMAHIGLHWVPGEELLRETIHRVAPVTVYAYRRLERPWRRWSEDAVERIRDAWYDAELGDIDTPLVTQLQRALTADLCRVLREVGPWQCELVAQRSYSEAEMLEMFELELRNEDPPCRVCGHHASDHRPGRCGAAGSSPCECPGLVEAT